MIEAIAQSGNFPDVSEAQVEWGGARGGGVWGGWGCVFHELGVNPDIRKYGEAPPGPDGVQVGGRPCGQIKSNSDPPPRDPGPQQHQSGRNQIMGSPKARHRTARGARCKNPSRTPRSHGADGVLISAHAPPRVEAVALATLATAPLFHDLQPQPSNLDAPRQLHPNIVNI